jgi:hypothetical protein
VVKLYALVTVIGDEINLLLCQLVDAELLIYVELSKTTGI